MAWKFRQEHVKDGDVIEPSEFRINTNEFVSEINGFLDSDNLGREAINGELVERGSFVEVIGQEQNCGFSYLFNHQLGHWQNTAFLIRNRDFSSTESMAIDPHLDGTVFSDLPSERERLPRSRFNASHDGLAICEFSGFCQWSIHHVHPEFDTDVEPSTSALSEHPHYSYYGKQSKYFKLKSSFVLCSMWRLTVNGMSVAETGPLGNEYEAHPIYLCGVSPVLKGKDVDVQLEGRFIWYAPGTGEMIECSSWAPPIDGSSGDTWRRDCALVSSNLIVTLRKR